MKYYELKKDYSVYNRLSLIKDIPYRADMLQSDFDKSSYLSVNYFKPNEFMQYSDVLTEPTFLVSEAVKKVFEIYDEEIKYKAIQIYSEEPEDNTNFLFFWPYINFLDCLSKKRKETDLYSKIILSKEKISKRHIFYIKNLPSTKLVISQAVAESMLRRGIYGFDVEEILIDVN